MKSVVTSEGALYMLQYSIVVKIRYYQCYNMVYKLSYDCLFCGHVYSPAGFLPTVQLAYKKLVGLQTWSLLT